jgi:hypothetical protein
MKKDETKELNEYDNAVKEFNDTLNDVRIDYRNIKEINHAKSSEELQQIIKSKPTEQLISADKSLKTGNRMMRWFNNLPLPVVGLLEAAFTAGMVAISQPIAKKLGFTNLTFKSYMKHPASLAVVAAGTVYGMTEKYSSRSIMNSAEATGLIHGELENRALKAEQSIAEHMAASLGNTPNTTVSGIQHESTVQQAPEQARSV